MDDFYNFTIEFYLVKKFCPELFDPVPSIQRDVYLVLEEVVVLLVLEPDLAAGGDENAPVVGQIVPRQLDHARVGEGGHIDLNTHVILSSWAENKDFERLFFSEKLQLTNAKFLFQQEVLSRGEFWKTFTMTNNMQDVAVLHYHRLFRQRHNSQKVPRNTKPKPISPYSKTTHFNICVLNDSVSEDRLCI